MNPIMSENLNSLAANAPILTVTGFDFWPEENDIIVTLFEVHPSARVRQTSYHKKKKKKNMF